MFSNEELVQQIQSDHNRTQNLEILYNQNMTLIRKTILPFTALDSEEDLLQEAFIALCSACDSFRPEKGYKFITHALKVLRGHIFSYINNTSLLRIPDYRRSQLLQLQKVSEAYFLKNGRKPSDTYLLIALGIKIEDLRQLKVLNAAMLSLDQPLDGEEDNTLSDTLQASEAVEDTVLEQLHKEQQSAVLWGAVDALPPEERTVIRSHYQDNETFQEIAEQTGATEAEVKKVQSSGLKKLRKSREIQAEYCPESIFYRGGLANFKRTWTSSVERIAMMYIS